MEEDLEDLYENAPCGYLSLGPDGRIIKSNLTLSAWIGFSREDMLGKRLRDLLKISGAIFYETHFAPLLRMQGHFNEVALDFVTADGKELPVFVNAVERRDDEGQLLFTRLTIFKATERRRYERDLVEARSAAERGLKLERSNSELREQFVAVLGHDLRNPLAGIDGALRRIQSKGAAHATPELIDLMLKSVGRMTELINDVLDLTRSRLGGGLQLNITYNKPLLPALKQVIAELLVAHPDRLIEEDFDLDEPVTCDQVRIAQLLSNLVSNALTYGETGEAIRVEATARNGVFRLSVVNFGDPIPQAAMERLFQPFYRGEVRSSLQGLGLGLYIASQIAKAHGGTLAATSENRSTEFVLVMPAEQPA